MFEIAQVIAGGICLLISFLLEIPSDSTSYSFLSTMFIAVAFIILASKALCDGVKKFAERDWICNETILFVAIIGTFLSGSLRGISIALFILILVKIIMENIQAENDDLFVQLDAFSYDRVKLLSPSGKTYEMADVKSAEVGDQIVADPNDIVLLDSLILRGEAVIDTSLLTGADTKEKVTAGDIVTSGSVVTDNQLILTVLRDADSSASAQIQDLLCDEQSRDSEVMEFVKKFNQYFPYIIIGVALLIAVVPSLVTHDQSRWIATACTILLLAMSIDLTEIIPMSFVNALGHASRNGIFVRGDGVLSEAADTKDIIFSKHALLTDDAVDDSFVDELRSLHLGKLVLLTSENRPATRSLAEELGIDEFGAELTDIEKKAAIDNYKKASGDGNIIMAVSTKSLGTACYNSADVKVAVNCIEDADIIRKADVAVMGQDPSKLGLLIRIAKDAKKITKLELILSMAFKAVTIILAVAGLVGPWCSALSIALVLLAAFIGTVKSRKYETEK